MNIIRKLQDMAGQWRVFVEIEPGEAIMLKFPDNPTDSRVLEKVNEYTSSPGYLLRSVITIPLLIERNKDAIEAAIRHIKQQPNLTLADWSSYLSSLSWYESSVVRWFTFALATGLAERMEIELADYTEKQVLGALRDWIVNTPADKLRRIIWGE